MSQTESQKNSTTSGYAGKKRRTNISVNGEYATIAQAYFPSTTYGSLSGFVEASLATLFRRKARKLKAAGYKLPAELFGK